MLRTSTLRLLDERDLSAALRLAALDPVAHVFVHSRLRLAGLSPWRLGAEVWGHVVDGELESLAYSGANLVLVGASAAAVRVFADRARRQGRRCSSIVGPGEATRMLWELLEPEWGPARAVRQHQPLMVIDRDSPVAADPLVRRVRLDEIELLLPAAVAMFAEEVGVSPLTGAGAGLFRARVTELVSGGRAFARIEGGRVVFKAEIGAATPWACQVQGVWVDPSRRGQGLSGPGMAAVVALARRDIAPTVSLYVNDFNAPARATYRRTGFAEVGEFATVLY